MFLQNFKGFRVQNRGFSQTLKYKLPIKFHYLHKHVSHINDKKTYDNF